MNKDEIDAMWHQAMRQSIEAGEVFTRYNFAKLVAEKALAQEKALQALHSENERLGLYKDAYAEQEPLAWISPSGALYRTRYHAAANAEQSLTPLYTHPPQRIEQNFCSRCGKRTPDLTHIHTCTTPKD